MFTRSVSLVFAPWILLAAAAAAEEPLFPFVISYDARPNVTNVSAWLERPAGKQGFVHAQDGRLVTAAGPIRFWATNLCFEACFPSHEQAERVAARLASLGINCVRMHHMDSRSIWGDSPNKLTIDPQKIERLDYLIHQLKLHGIYTDLNLHVSRSLGEAEGFVAQKQRPQYDKGLGNFEPRMIELQKKYARDLLTHVNPYTKTAYTAEPAIAFVEISNEDALFAIWSGNQLDNLPEPYATTYRKLWNEWLRKKYGSTDKLRQAWNAYKQPLGEELLINGDLSRPLEGAWHLEVDKQTKADLTVQPDGPEGRRSLKLVVQRAGEVAWHPQLTQAGFAVKKDAIYTLAFLVRSDAQRQIGVNCMMAHDPWQRLGLSAKVDVGPQWQPYRRTFTAERDEPNARITFNELKPGTYELAGVSLRPGGVIGLAAEARLEDDGVPVLRHGDLGLTAAGRNDFVDFLWDTERDYWWGMYHFLKDELKVQSLVSGTQLGYSPVHIQAGLDYIDAHAYWNHPRFPGRPWDPKNWTVRNVALVNSPGGTLASLATRRVAGMAYTVSEYNHPEPNQYAAEGFPMIAAFGAFQSWDGIFSFTYSHDTNFEPRKITGFFNINSATPRLVHMPACAAMFLRGDVAPAEHTAITSLSWEAERNKLREALSARKITADNLGLDPRLCLVHGMKMATSGNAVYLVPGQPAPANFSSVPDLPKDATRFHSDTRQLHWDVQQPDAGFYFVDTRRSKLFTGFARGRTFSLGNVQLKVGPTRLDWATISLVCIDGGGFDKPGRILIAATGLCENQGAKLEHLGGDNVTLGNQWGSEPIFCEGVPAELILPVAGGRVRFYPLDESGSRREAVPVAAKGDTETVLRLDPKHKTVWYEVQVR